MTRMLIQAAWNGDVDHLLKELDNNPTALHSVALEGSETPLHIACFAGHVNFVATVIKLRQEFSWELNQDGFTPLHIAAACGHAEIVKELLKVHVGLCLIKGKDGKIPLHMAVVKGKVEVVRELLWASSDSVACTTAQLETSLHLAVKNNQFEALQVLILHLKQLNKEDLLNSKDIYGNTILHIAVSKKQYEVVNFLLNGQVTSKEKIELNALNKSGLTPLDMLVMFQSEAGDREIEEILLQAGPPKSENLRSPAHTNQERPSNPDTEDENPKPRNWSEFGRLFRYNPSKESLSDVRNTILVILVLIMTATYQTALSPPGGLWQDDSIASTGNNTLSSNKNDTLRPGINNITASELQKPEQHIPGTSIMATNDPGRYIILMCTNSFGFYYSVLMITLLTYNFPMQFELLIPLQGLFFCYVISMSATAPDVYMKTIFSLMWFPMGIAFFFGTMPIRYIRRKLLG